MLDSGLWGRGPFANTTVALKRSFGAKLGPHSEDAKRLTGESLVLATFVGDGKPVRFRTAVFEWNVLGVPTKGYVGLDRGADPKIAGSMTGAFLNLFDVSYDFPSRVMCITPRSRQVSLARGKGGRSE